MLDQEFLHGFVELKLVLIVMETMAFVVFDHVLYFDAACFQGFYDLIALVFIDSWVAGAPGWEPRAIPSQKKKDDDEKREKE